MYHHKYLKYKTKYLNLKKINMKGGYFDIQQLFDLSKMENIKECLTNESIILMEQMKPIMEKYEAKLGNIIKPFDLNVKELIYLIKGNTKIEQEDYKITKHDYVLYYILQFLDTKELIKKFNESSSDPVWGYIQNAVYMWKKYFGLKEFDKIFEFLDIIDTDKENIKKLAHEIGIGSDNIDLGKIIYNKLKDKDQNNEYYKILVETKYNIKDAPDKVYTRVSPWGEKPERFDWVDNPVKQSSILELNDTREIATLAYYLSDKFEKKFIPELKYIPNRNNFITTDVILDLINHLENIKYLYIVKNNDTDIVSTIPNKELFEEIKFLLKIITKVSGYFGLKFEIPNIYLLLSDAKKYFPDHNAIFKTNSINSAEFTRDNILWIYRKEEISKLLLHELSHRANLEGRVDNSQFKEWNEKWAIERVDKEDLKLTETVTETMAQFMNVSVTAAMCHGSENFEQTFNNLWKNELMFGLYQTAKILYISGFKTNSEFTNKTNNERVRESTKT